MDEVSLGATTLVGELRNGQISEYEIHPEDFGFYMSGQRALKVDNPEHSKSMLMAVLRNEASAARDIVLLNAGVALYAANVAPGIAQGVTLAREALASGGALQKLEQFVARTQAFASTVGTP
jgi:anthranilate phosphoribosyltransferase